MIETIILGTGETLYMVIVSMIFSYIFGIPLGVLVYITDTNGICKNRLVNVILGTLINMTRSIPFLILLVAILPLTRAMIGTTIGSTATIIPLIVAATPFIARMVESSLKEVNKGVIEAAKAMGSSPIQIIYKVLLPEAKPSLMIGMTIAFATILAACIDGVRNKIEPPKPVDANIYKLTEKDRKRMRIEALPGSLEEALGYMRNSLIAKSALGEHILEEFVTAKDIEWDSFRTYVSQWELDKYLARY